MSSVYINQSLHLKPPLQCLTALESTGTNHGFSLPKYWKKLICTWNKIACVIHNFSLFWVGKNSIVSFSIIKKYQYWVSKTWKKSTSSNRLNEIHIFNWSQVLPYKCRHPPYSSIYCLWKKKKVSSSLPKTSQSEDTGIFSVFVCLYQLQLIHSLIACFY